MIDILTKYGVKKRTATAAKTVKHGAGAEFSTVRYDQYAKRFLEFINKCIEWWPWSLCSHFHSAYKLRRWRYFVPQILCYKWWSAKVTIKKHHFLYGSLNDTSHGTILCQRSHCWFHFLYNLHLWIVNFFFDCTEQDNFLFPVNNCRKSCNLQKKFDVIHILFCRTQQKFLWKKKKPQKLCRIFTIHLEMF